ncbi:TetR/AcrR family transcriptional regulator [Longispora albida]|uniref:TetR/AcrR family transcriptional regulator n=1 Tax=Longispora albida TaxID=203523 RepID=UPI00146A0D83|nr:TetR/AcrR family transcriptional regulator [Longispora albida]
MTDDGVQRGRPRDPEVADRVRRAAAALLFEAGFEATTVDEVARRAGVAKATVYRRWASKDDLILEAFALLLDDQVPLPGSGSLEADLRAIYASAVAMMMSEAGMAWVRTLAMESARNPQVAALLRTGMERRAEAAQRMLDRAVADGQARSGADARLLIELFNGLLLTRALGRLPAPTPEELEEVVQVTLRGIGV